MLAKQVEQLYCSVDLEFTGFDPSRHQILEIGFAFFKLSKTGFEVVEEWSQVFKPSMEVHPKILGLTGITQEELDNAPDFSEHRQFLQDKLGDAIIVGHNPVMDVKFLEGYGIKLSGKVVDTLELVQFILPTHHSYNLENLVHYFGVKHHKAHRALGDALSTIIVLENLVKVYQSFSKELKTELVQIFKKEEFSWQPIIETELDNIQFETNDSLSKNLQTKQLEPLLLSDQLINLDNLGYDHEDRVALGLQEAKVKSIVVVPDSGTVMRLWQNNLAHGAFKSEDTFSLKAFEKFLKNAQTIEELRFALKVIVWMHTNWQTEVVLDLNISFFGGQFRQFIVGGKPTIQNEQVIVTDYSTLQSITELDAELKARQLVVTDILNFEKYISSGFSTRLAWSNVLYALRLVYNPETEFGNLKLKDEVLSALAATDLFFGLVYILLSQTFPGKQYATIQELAANHDITLSRLQQAAQNLKEKIASITKEVGSGELDKIVLYLENFFEETAGRVKWITINEDNSSFHDQPIDISESTQKLLQPFTKVKFTDTITNPALLSYLVDRLGLRTEVSELPNKTTISNIEITEQTPVLNDKQAYELCISSALPLVMVMKQPTDIKQFYNSNYLKIKESAALFAQGYSGGGNKMFRNFSIKENSVLLVTADFMAKQNYLITAKNIVFLGVPEVDHTHPYTAALLAHWKNKHEDLLQVFSYQKIAAALKKLKLHSTISVKIFGTDDNFTFWG